MPFCWLVYLVLHVASPDRQWRVPSDFAMTDQAIYDSSRVKTHLAS